MIEGKCRLPVYVPSAGEEGRFGVGSVGILDVDTSDILANITPIVACLDIARDNTTAPLRCLFF